MTAALLRPATHIRRGDRSVRVSVLADLPRVWLDIELCRGMRDRMTRREWIDYADGLDQVRMPA